MALNVGDAFIRLFLGVEDFEQGVNKINAETPGKLGPAVAALDELGNAMDRSGEKAQASAAQMKTANERAAAAAKRVADMEELLREVRTALKAVTDDLAKAEQQLATASGNNVAIAQQKVAAIRAEKERMEEVTRTFERHLEVRKEDAAAAQAAAQTQKAAAEEVTGALGKITVAQKDVADASAKTAASAKESETAQKAAATNTVTSVAKVTTAHQEAGAAAKAASAAQLQAQTQLDQATARSAAATQAATESQNQLRNAREALSNTNKNLAEAEATLISRQGTLAAGGQKIIDEYRAEQQTASQLVVELQSLSTQRQTEARVATEQLAVAKQQASSQLALGEAAKTASTALTSSLVQVEAAHKKTIEAQHVSTLATNQLRAAREQLAIVNRNLTDAEAALALQSGTASIEQLKIIEGYRQEKLSAEELVAKLKTVSEQREVDVKAAQDQLTMSKRNAAGYQEQATAAKDAASKQQGAAAAVSAALGENSTAWVRLAHATVAETAATQQNAAAQEKLRVAIDAAARAGQNDIAAVERLALAEKNLTETEFRLAQAKRQTAIASNEAAKSSGLQAKSYDNTRDSVDLLSYSTGIVLPRELKKYVASLEQLQPILSAAFKVTVVLAFIDVIARAADSLATFVSDTFVFTEAMKRMQAEQVKLNNLYVEHKAKMEGMSKEYALLGLEGLPRARKEAELMDAQIAKNSAHIDLLAESARNAKVDVGAFGTALKFIADLPLGGISDDAGSLFERMFPIEEAKLHNATLQAALNTQNEELAAQKKAALRQGNLDALRDSIAFNNTIIELEKTNATRHAEIKLAERNLDNVLNLKGFSETLAAQRAYEAELRDISRKAIDDRIANMQRDPTRNAAALKAEKQKLLDIEKAHEKELIDNERRAAEIILKIRKASLVGDKKVQTIDVVLKADTADFTTNVTRAFDDVLAAYNMLHLEGSLPLLQDLHETEKAYTVLASSGKASALDIALASQKKIEAELAYARAVGASTGELEQQARAAEKNISKITGVFTALDKAGKKAISPVGEVFKKLIDGSVTASEAMVSFGTIMAESIGAAVTAALMGSESFGASMQKFLKSTLAALAGEAVVQAIVETAKGLAALSPMSHEFGFAGVHFASAAKWAAVAAVAGVSAAAIPGAKTGEEGGNSVAPGTAIETTPQQQEAAGGAAPEPKPIQQKNEFSFATGALITAPTRAVIGDARRAGAEENAEAVLPLEGDAMERLVLALTEAGAGGGGDTIHYYDIKGMVSSDSVKKLTRMQNREVRAGKVRSLATKAARVERKG